MRAAQDLLRRIPHCSPRRIADEYRRRGSMRLLLARRLPDAKIESFDLLQSLDHAQGTRGRFLRAKGKFD